MTPERLSKIIESEVGTERLQSKVHGIDLHKSIVTPYKITATNRIVKDGRISNYLEEVWVVLEEKPGANTGYKIYFDEDAEEFGLMSNGLKDDRYPILLGIYGSFMETLKSM